MINRITIVIMVYAAFFVAAYFTPALADEDSWSSGGPYDATVISIAIHPFDNQRLFIATIENFIFETTDGGGEWLSIEDTLDGTPGSRNMRVVKIHPFGPDTMFAATVRGLYKSTDAGQNWLKLPLQWPDNEYYSLEINRENPPVLFAGTWDSAWRSTDGGQSWEQMHQLPGAIEPIVADPVRPNIIYAGANTTVHNASIWKSYDSGVTWESIHNNLQFGPGDYTYASSISVDPVDPEIVYFARQCRYVTDPPEALVKSTNGGEHWMDMTPPGLTWNWLHGVTVSPVDHNTVFICTDVDGVLRSLDGGINWEEINEGIIGTKPRAQTVAVDPETAIIYLGRHSGGIYRSIDNGDSWEKISYNITGAQCDDIAANWNYPYTLYTTTGNGLYMSTDRAESWAYIDLSFPSAEPGLTCVEVDPFDPSYVYIGYYGYRPSSMALYRSTDGGASWESFAQGLPTNKIPIEIKVADYGEGNRRLFMALNAGLYYSDNLGENWALVGSGLPVTYFISLDVSPANPDLIYIGDSSHNLYRSADGGESWELLNNLPGDDRINDIVCDPIDPDVVYINIGYPGYSGIFKSTDGGQSWQDINNNLPRSAFFYTTGIAINPSNNDNVYVYSSGRGMFESHDGGQSWEDFNDGLHTTHRYAYTLIDPNDTSRVFMAKGQNSVWWISGPQTGGPCGHYIVGDYNGSETFNVADVISAFSKLQTGSPDAFLLCECPPGGNTWAVAMDVNNSCAFNIADVIAAFSKLQTGSPELVPCEVCPPDPSPSPPEGEPPIVARDRGSEAGMRTGSSKK